MSSVQQQQQLKRDLSNRHILLIALGSSVGTGLFLGSAGVMKSAGPAMILGYAICGLMAYLIMRQLGEMLVYEPVAGSFSYFAYKYWSDFWGFVAGWNYWVVYVLVSMAELTALAVYVQFWFPQLPTWISIIFFFVVINLINLLNVKLYGEAEFWLAIVKVATIIAIIVLGAFLLISNNGGAQASITNLWNYGGFFPNGISGMLMAMALIMFSFGGIELIGITAAEAQNPQQSIPKAINGVVFRILIFYIASLTILLSLMPWNNVVEVISNAGNDYTKSPFVLIFSQIGIHSAALILNLVIITAAISVYNSCVYCNSRMLYGLALQGNAPKIFTKLDKRGVPSLALLLSAIVTIFCVVLNYYAPQKAMAILLVLPVSALVINWCMISLAHLKFRKTMHQQQKTPSYLSIGYPISNYLCLLFVGFILVVIMLMPGLEPYQNIANGQILTGVTQLITNISLAVILIPFWLGLLWLAYKYKCYISK